MCDVRALLKLAVFELKSKYPVIIMFLMHALSKPVTETVRSRGPVLKRVML